jgi:hypothetical protein
MAKKTPGITGGARLGKTADETALHSRLMSWYSAELRRQGTNRYQMSIDEDYYDSIHWMPAEAREVKERGQFPVVYNEVKPTIDWLIGTERRNRVDFKIMAQKNTPADNDVAADKTKLLKYLAEVNRIESERSRSANEQFKAGLGWIETGISPNPEDEPLFVRHESWRNILYDSLGVRLDLEDSRYLFRFRVLDLDIAIACWPDKEQQLRASSLTRSGEFYMEWWNGKALDDVDFEDPTPMYDKYEQYDASAWQRNTRERVMLIEAWYKEPTRVSNGGATSIDRIKMQMQCTILTDKYIIMSTPSPYVHNRFPFIPMWCYRRARDGAPYGPIRPVRGPQDSLNKRMSKALFVLSTNQVQAEYDAFDPKVMTAEQARDEYQAPDGFVLLAKGGLEKVKAYRDTGVVSGHLELAGMDQAAIRQASGITSENLGRDTNVTSGVGINAKAEQGGLLTAEIFDNMLLARQMEGEICLSLIEQFYNDEKDFSITGERSTREYASINVRDPVTGTILNDITARKSMFIIGEQAWKQSMQRAAFESVMQLMGQLAPVAPMVVSAMLDVVFELSDLPNKQLMLSRIRQATGMPDPDAAPDPAVVQAQQQSAQQVQQIAQMQFQAKMAQLQADIQTAQAQGKNLDAKTLETTLKAIYVAMQAAQVAATVPNTAPAADTLLDAAGFHNLDQGAPGGGMPASPSSPQIGIPPFPGEPLPAQIAGQPAPSFAAHQPLVNHPAVIPPATTLTPAAGMPPNAPGMNAPANPPPPALAAGAERGINTTRNDGTQK